MICLANPIFSVPATDWVIGGVARAVVNHQSSGSERALSLLFRGPKIEAHPTIGLEQGSVRFYRSGSCGIGRWFSRDGARSATSTPFVHEGPRRTTENCNCRTATATPFVHEGPRRTTKGREELQRQLQERQWQHLLSSKGREGPRRTTLTPFVRGGARRTTLTPFVHEGPRRTATATSGTATATPFVHEGPLRATKGHEEHL